MMRENPVAVHAPGGASPAYDGPSPTPDGRPMPLHLRQLLDDPGLGLELVAGGPDASLLVPIRWAHIAETPDPTPWLEGGELLLTTGLGVRDDPEAQRRLVEGLTRRGCVAIGFGVGVSMPGVPQAMLDAADRCGIPLFTVPFEVPFIAVTRRVAKAVFDEHFATLRSAVDLHRRVLASVIAGDGIDAVLNTTGPHLPDAQFVVYDFGGQLLAQRASAAGAPDPEVLWPSLVARHRDRDRAEVEIDGWFATSAVVRVGAEIQAVLAVVSPEPLREHEQLLVEQSLAGISLELARGHSRRESRRIRVDELVEEVAAGRAGVSMVTRVLERLGADPDAPYRILCVPSTRDASQQSLCAVVEDVLTAAGHPPVVGRFDGDTVALVDAADDHLAEDIATAIIERGWAGVTVGRSGRKESLDVVASALREARTAAHDEARPPGGVRDIETIGIEGMLASIRDGIGARTFVTQVLGPVLRYDHEESSSLAETLRAYLAHGCRPGPAAEQLSIHRHTLAYRLDRIRDLTGRDPRDGAHLLEFGLALELADGTSD